MVATGTKPNLMMSLPSALKCSLGSDQAISIPSSVLPNVARQTMDATSKEPGVVID